MARSFWTDRNITPKTKFRWLVYFGSMSYRIPPWAVKSITKPSFQFGAREYHAGGEWGVHAGKLTWNPVELTLVDTNSPDVAWTLIDMLSTPGEADGTPVSGINISNPDSYGGDKAPTDLLMAQLGEVKIYQIGEDEKDILEKWTLMDAYIESYDFGELSYEDESLSEVKLTIKYMSAKFNY